MKWEVGFDLHEALKLSTRERDGRCGELGRS